MYRYLPLLLIALASLAQGEEFTSPNSRVEECRILPPMPGVTLSEGDQAKEKELCGIDFYGGAVALCPKTWSTSAAVMVYDIKGSGLAPQAYESQRCATREDDSAAVIRERLDAYERQTSPVLDYYRHAGRRVIEVDANSGPPGLIFQRICQAMETDDRP